MTENTNERTVDCGCMTAGNCWGTPAQTNDDSNRPMASMCSDMRMRPGFKLFCLFPALLFFAVGVGALFELLSPMWIAGSIAIFIGVAIVAMALCSGKRGSCCRFAKRSRNTETNI